jgi:hypothetical protein
MEWMSSISCCSTGTACEVPQLGISLPIDHMITAGEFFAPLTISLMS